MIVLAVDPGKATGIAIMSWEPEFGKEPELLDSSEVQPEEFADAIELALQYNKNEFEEFYVACESFTINAQTAKNSLP